jgi:voltage-gated potassium channel
MKFKKVSYIISVAVAYVLLLKLLVFFENQTDDSSITDIWEAFWYSVVTLTTVGYGDSFPQSIGGRLVGFCFIFGSIGLIGYIIGLITDKIKTVMDNKLKGDYGANFKDHFIIVGWNNFAKLVAEQVTNAGKKIVVITQEEADIGKIYDQFGEDSVFVLYSDLLNYKRYSKANITKSAAVFINFEDDSKNLINLINIKNLYPEPEYVVSLKNGELKDTFSSTGVTFSISVNEVASKLVASYVFEPDVALFTEDLMGSSSVFDNDDNDISQFYIKGRCSLIGKTYFDTFIDLKRDYNAILMGLSRKYDGSYKLIKNPSESMNIQESDYILVIANGLNMSKIEQLLGVSEGLISNY